MPHYRLEIASFCVEECHISVQHTILPPNSNTPPTLAEGRSAPPEGSRLLATPKVAGDGPARQPYRATTEQRAPPRVRPKTPTDRRRTLGSWCRHGR